MREYDVGAFEGLPYGGEWAWRWEEYERIDRCWRQGDRDARFPGGESLKDMETRFLPFMSHLSVQHAPASNVLIVSHGGLYRNMLPMLFANVSPAYAQLHGFGHCRAIVGIRNASEWRCRQWGDDCLDEKTTS